MRNKTRWLAPEPQAKSDDVIWRPRAIKRRRKLRKLYAVAAALPTYTPTDGHTIGFYTAD